MRHRCGYLYNFCSLAIQPHYVIADCTAPDLLPHADLPRLRRRPVHLAKPRAYSKRTLPPTF